LGILRAGGAYPPVEPDSPRQRVQYMLDDAGAAVVVTSRQLCGSVPVVDGVPVVVVEDLNAVGQSGVVGGVWLPDQAAYVMYTSGSTGQPKGIVTTHRDVVELVLDQRWQQAGFPERVLVHAPHAFDASTYELWVPLVRGGQLVVAPLVELDAQVLR
jgi:non-ribosomal peptide synthetase component F